MQEQYVETLKDGAKHYYKDKAKTMRHRLDGPAIEWADGDKSWYVNGKRHRLDGPAVEYTNGNRSWYVNGVFIMSVDNKGRLIDKMK
jgi:hypothetical protein